MCAICELAGCVGGCLKGDDARPKEAKRMGEDDTLIVGSVAV